MIGTLEKLSDNAKFMMNSWNISLDKFMIYHCSLKSLRIYLNTSALNPFIILNIGEPLMSKIMHIFPFSPIKTHLPIPILLLFPILID